MKKLILVIIAVTAMFVACQKEKQTLPQEEKHDVSFISFPVNTDQTPGGWHNYSFVCYDSIYGPIGIDTTYGNPQPTSEIDSITRRCCVVLDSINWNPFSTVDSLRSLLMSDLISDAYIVNGVLIDFDDRMALAISKMPKASIRTAFTNIWNYNGSIAATITYAKNQVNSLQNLTTLEQTIVDGYISVLEKSPVIWGARQELTTEQKVLYVAKMDAIGYAKGMEKASHSPFFLYPGYAVLVANASAMTFSAYAVDQLRKL